MTADVIGLVAGAAVAFAFNVVPGLSTWFAKQSSEYKQLFMIGAMVLVAAGAFGASCLGWFGLTIPCTTAGAGQLVQALLLAVAANQGVDRIMPKPAAVKNAKREGKFYRGEIV